MQTMQLSEQKVFSGELQELEVFQLQYRFDFANNCDGMAATVVETFKDNLVKELQSDSSR